MEHLGFVLLLSLRIICIRSQSHSCFITPSSRFSEFDTYNSSFPKVEMLKVDKSFVLFQPIGNRWVVSRKQNADAFELMTDNNRVKCMTSAFTFLNEKVIQ